jgi:hypothetical protein
VEEDVRLTPAQFVKPFVKSNKNDFIDAEAIAEAVERKNMRFVPIKTDDQLDFQAIPSSAGPAHRAAYGSDQPAKGVSARTWPGVCEDASQAQGRHGGHPRERRVRPDAADAQLRRYSSVTVCRGVCLTR